MRVQKVLAREFQFYLPDLDIIALVECREDEFVTIRATKSNCPEPRKILFIRELATEGFIPDDYQWFSGATDGSGGVLWIKDFSWLQKSTKSAARFSNRFMCRLLIAACVLWLAAMRVLIATNTQASISVQKNSAMALTALPAELQQSK